MPPKPMKQKHIFFDHTVVVDGTEEELLEWLVLGSVKASSAKQYESHRNVLARFLCTLRGLQPALRENVRYREYNDDLCATCTRSEFIKFIASRCKQGSSSGEPFRSALQQLLYARGVDDPFTEMKSVTLATASVAKQAAASKIEKGCISWPMFTELLGICTDSELRNAFGIMFLGALRICEFKKLLVGDLQPDVGELMILVLRKTKTQQSGEKNVPALIKPFFDAASLGKKHGEWLFPKGMDTKMAGFLAHAAEELCWPVGLVWACTHVMRIGGDATIQKKLAQKTACLLAKQSPSVFDHYVRPNSERIAPAALPGPENAPPQRPTPPAPREQIVAMLEARMRALTALGDASRVAFVSQLGSKRQRDTI
jgi:hypothetical protein